MSKTDIGELGLDEVVAQIVGRNAWQVGVGHGSFITMEFGEPAIGKPPSKRVHGEWHLWIYSCSWRIEKSGQFLAGCEDPRDVMTAALDHIEGRKLLSFNVNYTSLDAELCFDNGIILRLFSIYSESSDDGIVYHWSSILIASSIV